MDIRRHISCEVCDISVSGGYDPELNQVKFKFFSSFIYISIYFIIWEHDIKLLLVETKKFQWLWDVL